MSGQDTTASRMIGGMLLPSQDTAPALTSVTSAGRKQKIAFMFAHEQSHQIPHSVPILNAICEMDESLEVHAFVLGDSNLGVLRQLMSPKARKTVQITVLRASAWAVLFEKIIGGAGPLKRISALRSCVRNLSDMTLITAPDVTSIMLRTKFGLTRPKLVFTNHGAGDRAVGFDPKIGRFDHVFVPGEKTCNRMLEQGVIQAEQCSVIGYPKFDVTPLETDENSKLFDNDKPTVLYNPHFDPTLSSWYKDGEAVLDFFAKQDRYNLIFAPHVMLFTRKLHITSDLKAFRFRKRLSGAYAKHSNIHVDVGSVASIDMSYTRMADIYLGDVSSQIYEFLATARPCLFLNTHNVKWRDDLNYAHWRLGDVIPSAARLAEALAEIEASPARYAKAQEEAFRETFGSNTQGSARRAAGVLLKLARNSANAT